MKIKLNIDTQEYKEKPATFDGRLRNRLCSAASIREVTPEQLIESVKRGRSFTPAVMTGTTGDTWQAQQVICADIDNDTGGSERLEKPLTPEAARQAMAQHGIDPYFMYYSFRNAAQWPKYRIVLVLDEALTDPDEANDLVSRFTGIFNSLYKGQTVIVKGKVRPMHCADTTAADNARLYYGGRADSVFYTSGKTTSISLLRALPVYEDEQPADLNKTPVKGDKEAAAHKSTAAQPNGKIRPLSELQAQFEADKESFNLARYVESTTNSRAVKRGRALFFNPCPICGHKDDFQVTGSVYHCHSASGGTGGSIIDYLINRDGLTTAAACDKFKYEIMGYDREEWRQAFIAEKYPNTTPELPTEAAERIPTPAPAAEWTENKPHNTGDYIKELMGAEIEQLKEQSNRKTGFKNLDAEAGSIYAGLYVIGGISAVGKTTFISQIADQMAEQGQHVLFFSMEQSRLEMVSKSIARQTAKIDPQKAVSSLQIRTGAKGEIITQATANYLQSIGDRVSVIEGNFNCTVSYIRDYARTYSEKNGGVKPVIIVDYLQVLQADKDPVSGRKMTDTRQIIDHNVTELKRLSREGMPIFVISSVNRSNYLTPIDFEAFKESGGIEFTCDVCWGLQLTAIHDEVFDSDKKIKEKREKIAAAKEAMPREVELVCLKNRYGKSRYAVQFTYYPQYDYFVPVIENEFMPYHGKTPWDTAIKK